jgi:hypothetical protein
MTVYVHEMPGQGRWFALTGGERARRNLPSAPWFVLTADSDDELHGLAASLGLTRVMFKPGKDALPRQKPEAARYPITISERDRAVSLGAKLITAREAARMLQQRASGMGFG